MLWPGAETTARGLGIKRKKFIINKRNMEREGGQGEDGFPENPRLTGPLPSLPRPETEGTGPWSHHPSDHGAESLLLPKMKQHKLAFWRGVPEPGDRGRGAWP